MTIEDDGNIDEASFGTAEVLVADLPDDCLLYLMGSRYCETDSLSQIAWDMFGKVPEGGDARGPSAASSIGTSNSIT